MGNTGNSSGAHLHLGLRLADANGNAINLNNGFKGFVNPKEALESFNKNSPYPPVEPPTPPTPVVNFEQKYNDEVIAHNVTKTTLKATQELGKALQKKIDLAKQVLN